MKSISRTVLILLLACAACTSTPTVVTPNIHTLVAQTVSAMHTQTAEAPTPTMVIPTPLPTFTPIPTLVPTPTPVPPTATETPSLVVGSVEDITIPAWTTLQGGQTFTKVWQISNGGTAAWGSDYQIVYVSGDKLGVSSITLGRVVYPGSSIQISVTFTAPTSAGSHTTNFMMVTDNGYEFGLGAGAGVPWSIKIKTSSVFAVTAATLAASPTSYSGACPSTIKFTPTISTNGPGEVTYYIRFDNGVSDTFTLNFTAAGSITGTSVSWPIDNTMTSLSALVYVDQPNHQNFTSLSVTITCAP